jgi:PBSX family phage portal protein
MTNALTTTNATSSAGAAQPMMFTFGEPESAIAGYDLWSYFELWHNGRWYEPPVPMVSLAKAMTASVQHRSAIALKCNLLVKHFQPTRWMTRAAFERAMLDFLQLGWAAWERIDNLAGRPMQLRHTPAAFTRIGVQPGTAWFVKGPTAADYEFRPNSLITVHQPDLLQEIYGVPEWLAALQSMLLNENATMFRRRYYLNGAHAGFIFYLSEPLADKETADMVRDKLQAAKGRNNFKNIFLNVPGGKKDGVQLIPISDVAAKDEFMNIKNVTRDDVLSAHRVPPQLVGVIPQGNSGFGDPRTAMDVFFTNEIEPIMSRMLGVNEELGVEVIRFTPYVSQAPGTAPAR